MQFRTNLEGTSPLVTSWPRAKHSVPNCPSLTSLQGTRADKGVAEALQSPDRGFKIADVIVRVIEEAGKAIAHNQAPLSIGNDLSGKPRRKAEEIVRRDPPQIIGKYLGVVDVS